MRYQLPTVACCCILLLLSTKLHAQQPVDTSKATHTAAAGPQFKASGWHQFWWGKHWRKEWLQPVTFPVFRIDTVLGGLTPEKLGGGHQTKSLRLHDKTGKEYILRTIDKNLELLIPEEFKGSIVNDIVNDQISTAHPYGPLSIASLAGAIGSLHTNPVIVFVPDDPSFGEFQKIFANKLCLFEERPSGDGWENTAFTNYADKVHNSEKLLENLREDNDKQVDQHAFLRIRLLDMLVNDWDRHPDQWVWTAYKKDGRTTYYPFARDRDQAFSKTDGVNIFLLSLPWVLRSVRNINANIHDVIGVNLAAVTLDKQFLNELTKEDWEATIKSVQQALTDDAIHEAILKMPSEIYNMSGAWLEKRLKQRRDNMMFYGMKYYRIINKRVFLTGTDKRELVTIDKTGNRTTTITIQKLNKQDVAVDTIFHRLFDRDLTREINIYPMGDEDVFVYKGQAKNKIFIRNIGGEGNDTYLNLTSSKGTGHKTRIYDTVADSTDVDRSFSVKQNADTTYTFYDRKAFKYDWYKPSLLPAFTPDDGVTVGVAFTYRRMQWHKYPYGWEQTIGASYATATGAIGVYYKAIFREAIGKWDLVLNAHAKAARFVLNYYGNGNDTRLNDADIDYFRVRSSGFLINPGVSRTWKSHTIHGGLLFQGVKVQSTAGKFISQPGVIDPTVFESKYFAGANAGYTNENVNRKKNPDLGTGYHLGAAYLVNTQETGRSFAKFDAYAKVYLPVAKGLTLAHRTGGAVNVGDYEFYQANTIGGTENLRGYWRTRFNGKSSFYQNTELRLQLLTLKGYVFRGLVGMYGFFDDGRVWVKEDDSDKIHTGYGGGLYFMPYNKLSIDVSYAMSTEVNVFTLRTGFFF
ncbi:hypothetical protein [Ferruginibacter sp. HRS2-29]|uniref:hypothetical protein n=1 Tax=Ferruginibacter sp. HRS2-29 TaxID=2487334 RepID=UPI0020CCE15E|nr:hypothetical protein [Ferruginibacter sp. HRS2-29]